MRFERTYGHNIRNFQSYIKSLRRDAWLQKIRKDILLEYPGFRVLCPTKWTIRDESMKGIRDNWVALQNQRQNQWCKKMNTFNYFYRITIVYYN